MIIRKFDPNEWESLKEGILNIEKQCFDEALEMTEDEVKDSVCSDDAIVFLAFDGETLVGTSYMNSLDDKDADWFDGYWNPKEYAHYGEGVIYITSTAVLPEYQFRGVAQKIKVAIFEYLKNTDYKYIVGHCHEGAMVHINEKSGGTIVSEHKNWYGGDSTHYLVEIKLK